jgi:hypothetical protein
VTTTVGDLLLGGFTSMLLGLLFGVVALWRMTDELTTSENPVCIPKWHIFVRFLSNDIIQKYALQFSKSKTSWHLLQICWVLTGTGIALVVVFSITNH